MWLNKTWSVMLSKLHTKLRVSNKNARKEWNMYSSERNYRRVKNIDLILDILNEL